MKFYTVIFSFVLFLSFQINTFSQNPIPNAGFESWTNSNPNDWQTIDFPGFYDAVTQSNDSHSLSSAARMEITEYGESPVIPILTTAFPITESYTNLKGYYKFIPQNEDQFFFGTVYLYQGSTPTGYGYFEIYAAASSYTEFDINIDPFPPGTGTPDNASIEFIISDTSSEGTPGIGTYALIDDLSFSGTTDVEHVNQVPSAYLLKQNYPNPFNPSTTIEFSIPEESFVDLKVYNLLGKEIAVLVSDTYSSGSYKVNFNGENLASGIYLAKINATTKVSNLTISKTLKMSLIK